MMNNPKNKQKLIVEQPLNVINEDEQELIESQRHRANI
jgi:hypothetical protein